MPLTPLDVLEVASPRMISSVRLSVLCANHSISALQVHFWALPQSSLQGESRSSGGRKWRSALARANSLPSG
eukprot:2628032-Rhodomonas_salina.2